MEITINHIDESEKELFISVPWQAVADEYDDLLTQYAKIPIRGFRAGHTPTGLIESTFRTEMRNDLAAGAAKRFCRTALENNNLRSATGLSVTDITLLKGDRFAFKVSFIALPKIELPDFASYKLSAKDDAQKRDEILERLLTDTPVLIHRSLIDDELCYSQGDCNSPTEREEAEKRVKLILILKEIAHRDAIEVDERDLEERIALLAQQNDVSAKQLREYLTQNNALDRVAESLLAEQVLSYIIELCE